MLPNLIFHQVHVHADLCSLTFWYRLCNFHHPLIHRFDPLLRLGQVEGTLAFSHSEAKLLAHNVERAVVRKFEVVDAGHHRGKVVVRRVRTLRWLAHDREHGRERLEPCLRRQRSALVKTHRCSEGKRVATSSGGKEWTYRQ